MNEISVNTDPAQGINIDTSHTPLGITLPSGRCVLAFTVSLDDGSSALGKKIGLSFIDRTTRKPAANLQIVKDDQNQWRYTSVQSADASGTVKFELQVPVPLQGNLEIVAVLMGEPKYFDGRNRLTFIPTEHVVDHSGQVVHRIN